jgi:hypothetical protein
MTFHNATNGLMLNIAPAHTMKKNTIVNTSQNFDTSITLICVNIRTNLAQTKHKKKNKIKIGVKLRKNFDTTKKIYEQKIVTNKFGGAQTKTYYTQ